MHLGLRLLFGFFLVAGLAGFFVMRVFVAEVKPSVRQVMEDMMVDTANLLAELASDDLATGRIASGRFAQQVAQYAQRPVAAKIWGVTKESLDFRVYVTDAKGLVLFDSENTAQGQDFSQWRDVARTLRGEYGARATREVQTDESTSVMYVAAPMLEASNGKVVGVLTVAKPVASIQAFIDRAERKIFLSGLLLLALSAAVGVAVTLWVVASVRRLRRYANAVQQQGAKPPVPRISGELGELAEAMDAMRQRLDGRDYIEAYVQALTHELKSPLTALRSAGELLAEPGLPAADQALFAAQVQAQTLRLQSLVERLLALSRLEHREALPNLQKLDLHPYLQSFTQSASVDRRFVAIEYVASFNQTVTVQADPELLDLALSNLLENACAFAPQGSRITFGLALTGGQALISVQDQGPGVPDYALPKLGQRFFSTARPNDPAPTKSSGLGLAITLQVMRLHGGTVAMRNGADGGFRVELGLPLGRG